MCGIAGIIYRDGSQHAIGDEMTRMLQSMKHRGPDSTGYALYGSPENGNLVMRYKLADANTPRDFEFEDRLRRHRIEVEARLASLGARNQRVRGGDAVRVPGLVRLRRRPEAARRLRRGHPRGRGALARPLARDRRRTSATPRPSTSSTGSPTFTGTHAIGHVRMATESEVDIAGAHPYWAYPYSDVAVVHNGQLTNYFMWRRRLERAGRRFMSECDSEIIAVYLAEKMTKGATLEEAMHQSLDELDGVFTYIAVTQDELGVAKDELAAKPLVLYESDDLVALASEEIAIRADRRPRDRHVRPLRARGAGVAAVGERQISYDARGLAEPVAEAPRTAVVEDGVATFDARDLTTRTINLELRRLLYEEGIDEVVDPEPAGPALARRRDPAPLQDHVRGLPRLLRLRTRSTARRSTSRAASAGRRART